MQKTRSAKAPLKSPASQRLLNLRTRLERAVEKAIALLDELDGDPDLEPSLAGYQPLATRSQTGGPMPGP